MKSDVKDYFTYWVGFFCWERNYPSEKLLCIQLPLTQPAEKTANINTKFLYGDTALLFPHAQFKQNG